MALGVKPGVKVDDFVGEVVPEGERVEVGLRVRDGLGEAVGETPPAARRYSVPPSSATTMSLSLDSEGEPRTGRGSGTDHSLPPVLFIASKLPVPPLTLVPTTNALEHVKCAGVDSVKVSLVELRL